MLTPNRNSGKTHVCGFRAFGEMGRMVKRLGLWLVLLVSLGCLGCSSNAGSSSTSGSLGTKMAIVGGKNAFTPIIRSRKLKGIIVPSEENKNVTLEDYNSNVNPVPSSTASVRPGPIQHGAPQIPYIPVPIHPPPPVPPHPPHPTPSDEAMHVGSRA